MNTGATTGEVTVKLTGHRFDDAGVHSSTDPTQLHGEAGSVLRTALILGALALGVLLPNLDAHAQTGTRGAAGDAPQVPETLTGCRLPLPGGRDRDAGLARLHLANQQGSRYLLTPSITLRQSYTDNVTLANENTESDFITGIIPALTFCRSGPRLRAQADYQAELFHFWDDSSRDDVFHRFNADTTTTLVQDRLFFDAGALFRQQPISSRDAFSADNALATENRTDALTLEASPYVFQSLGPVGNTVTRYTYTRTDFNEGISDVERHIGSFNLTSPEGTAPLTWQGAVRSERVSRDDSAISSFYRDDGFAELGYLLTERFSVVARGGYETRTRSDGSQDRFGSSYWESGIRWRGDRTNIDARYGRRFFGDTYFAAISHQANRLNLRASYEETQQISDRFVIGDPEIRIDVDPITGEPELIQLVDIEQEVFVSKRATVAASYELPNSVFNVRAFQDRREFVVAEDTTERYGADVSWRWQWLPRTALIPRAQWQKIEFRDDRTDTAWLAQVSVAHLLSPNMQAGATIRRQKQTSDDASAEYTENAVILSVTRVF